MIENTYICKNHLETQRDDCAVQLIRHANIGKCEVTPVRVTDAIIQSITNEYVLAIPTNSPLKVHKLCQTKEIVFLNHPNLVKISRNCGISILDNQFWNKEDIIPGNPFILPQMGFSLNHSVALKLKPLELTSLNLKDIKSLSESRYYADFLDEENIHPVVWSFSTSFLMVTLAMLLMFAVWKFYQFKKTKRQPTGHSTTERDVPENNMVPLLFPSRLGGVMNP